MNFASIRSYTTPLHSKIFSSDKESREKSFKEINTTHSSSIRILPRNTPPIKPLVNNPSSNGRPSTCIKKCRKLPKEVQSDKNGL